MPELQDSLTDPGSNVAGVANVALLATAPPVGASGVCVTGMPSNYATMRNLAATVTQAKGASAIVYGILISNSSGATAFVQLFNKATAGSVTLGTTVPDMEIIVPTATSISFPLPDEGVLFANGIQAASTTAAQGAVGSAAGVNVHPLFV